MILPSSSSMLSFTAFPRSVAAGGCLALLELLEVEGARLHVVACSVEASQEVWQRSNR
jgi:hypothetical protein